MGEQQTNPAQAAEFWKWFRTIAKSLATNVEDALLIHELDSRITELNSELSWEIGPGRCEAWQLVISPNLDRDLLHSAREIISLAPVIEGWEFYSGRRAKVWDYKFILETPERTKKLDAAAWKFVLLKYPDGIRELLLQASDLPEMNEDERWQAAAIVLESILGEEALMDNVDGFELVDHLKPRFSDKLRPIQQLRQAVLPM